MDGATAARADTPRASAATYDPDARFEVTVSEVDLRQNAAGRMLKARIYQPKGPGPFPTVLDLHGGGWNRKDRPIVRPRTVEWNAWLAGMAAARPGVTTADVFAVVDQLLANPVAYGIEELKKRDPERSLTTWLMFDASHFGGRGQEIIATVVAAALSKA